MKKETRYLTASVAARLLNRARQTGDDYQTLLTSFSLTYPPEAVIAEKLEAIIVLGDRNSRIRDFFDLQYLANRFDFERATLAEAVRRTFARPRTPVPVEDPIGLTAAYWENASRGPQAAAFARRAGLTVGPEPGLELLHTLRPVLLPILDDLRSSTAVSGKRVAGGPWR